MYTICNPAMVSVAIPAYKPNYLAEAIESALNQDYLNIELIIVNDCSPYDLDSIIKKYDDIRIRYFVNEKNLGKKSIVHNWNKCLEYAKGEYFVLLCDDDILEPDFVSKLLSLAKIYPSCNVFHSGKMTFDMRNGQTSIDGLWPEYQTFQDFSKVYYSHDRYHTVSEFLIKTSAIKKIGYIEFPVGYYSDDATLLELAYEGGIVSCQDPLAVFRVSGENITSSSTYNKAKVHATVKYIKWLKKNQERFQVPESFIDYLQGVMFHFVEGTDGINKIAVASCIPFSWKNGVRTLKILTKSVINSLIK